MLILLGFFKAFALLVSVLTVVDHFADGGLSVGRDLNEVKSFSFCDTECLFGPHDSKLFSGIVYDADLGYANLFVDSCISHLWFSDTIFLQFALLFGNTKKATEDTSPRSHEIVLLVCDVTQ